MAGDDVPHAPYLAAIDGLGWSLMERYLAGECSDDERQRVALWAAVPAHAAALAWARSVRGVAGQLAPHHEAPFDTLGAWEQFEAAAGLRAHEGAIARFPVPTSVSEGSVRDTRGEGPWTIGKGAAWRWATAAPFVVALGIGLVVRLGVHGAMLGFTPGRVYATAAGQRLSVTLADGTQLTLAPASRVAVSYAPAAREVKLEGEAYFSVTHDAARPFSVRARAAVVRDIGTAFDIRAYPKDTTIRVAVTDGIVSVGSAASHRMAPVEARAGDAVTVGASGAMIEHAADVAAFTGWTAGQLSFNDAPVGEIVSDIERWYDVDITLDPSLSSRRLKLVAGSLSITEVLDEIALLADARYERVGRRVTFTSRHLVPLRGPDK